jgi:hypothetical protein
VQPGRRCRQPRRQHPQPDPGHHHCGHTAGGEVLRQQICRVLAARASLVSQDQTLVETRLVAVWTDDHTLSARLDPRVAHYSGQAELAAAIQHGLAARDAGDFPTATAMLGRAVHIATGSGHHDTADLLGRLVDVVDARTGSVQLRHDTTGIDAELANVRSVKTVRSNRR